MKHNYGFSALEQLLKMADGHMPQFKQMIDDAATEHQQARQAVERATQALERLEAAIDAGDNRRIGAALYELRRALKTLHTLTQEQQS